MAIIADRFRQPALHEGIAARYGLGTEHLASGGLTCGPHLLYRFPNGRNLHVSAFHDTSGRHFFRAGLVDHWNRPTEDSRTYMNAESLGLRMRQVKGMPEDRSAETCADLGSGILLSEIIDLARS